MADWFTPGKLGMAVLTMLAVAITWAVVSFTGDALWEKVVTEVRAQTTKELDTRIGTVESTQRTLVRGVANLNKTQGALVKKVDGLANAIELQSGVQETGYNRIIKLLENQK